jgi:hypothetical protein
MEAQKSLKENFVDDVDFEEGDSFLFLRIRKRGDGIDVQRLSNTGGFELVGLCRVTADEETSRMVMNSLERSRNASQKAN